MTYDTPYRNVKPDVKYVGDAVCETCHAGICKSYHAHPMGRSAGHISGAPVVEKYPASGPVTVSSGPFELRVEKTSGGVSHHVKIREPGQTKVSEAVVPVQVVIGSGTRGRSYLSVEDGYVWQSPVSWYGPEERWDLSPGFDIGRSVRLPVDTACLFCHTDPVQPVAGTENRFREPLFPRQAGIGCERCHGPGELHVAERTRDLSPPVPDTSIVNPRHLSPALQLAVCEQCHLQGQVRVVRRGRDLFEYRPGLPFELFVSVYIQPLDFAGANNSGGQFEQLEQSRCFTRSGGRLTCTNCHDPHAVPAEVDRDAHFRQRCLNCHQRPNEAKCSLDLAARQAKGDNCVVCHMPKAPSTSIAHASVTNHRMSRTADPLPAPRPLAPGELSLVRFRPGAGLPPGEIERDLGIALARYAAVLLPHEDAARGYLRVAAAERLKASLARWPADVEAWVALAGGQTDRADPTERLKAAKAAVKLAPESAAALTTLTEAASAAGEYDLAVEAAGKWAGLSPRLSDPLVARAFVHLKRADWVKAEADCRAALKLHPLHAEAHLYLAVCLHHRGDPAGGAKEAETAAQLEPDPRERANLTEWYRQATR